MSLLRSILFSIFFYLGTIVAVFLALPAAWMGRRPLVAVTHGWARWHRLCARYLLGIRSVVEGQLPAGPVLVAAKHQSMYETIEMLLVLNEPAVVMKRELTDLPGWGLTARRYGVIPVDREGGAAALRRMLKAAREASAAGRSIVIFPEGTRVPSGEQPPLQPGFAGLYAALKLPVVPLALDSGRLWPRRAFVKRPGLVTLRFGDPLPPGLPRGAIEERVHGAINALERAAAGGEAEVARDDSSGLATG
jgi:1-acyl-sn-glycerol-3-phosphate acyltransferase